MKRWCQKCAAKLSLVDEVSNALGSRFCDPCLSKIKLEAEVLRDMFDLLVGSGMMPEFANQIVVARMEGREIRA